MLKFIATGVSVSKGANNTPALKFSEKGDFVRFRIGAKVYDARSAKNHNGGEFRVGDMVVATPESPWEGLCGTITEIRDGDDRETENDSIDIYCEFLPPTHPEEIRRLEDRFSDLYGMEKRLDDISLDMVIMAPSMIRVIGRKDGDRKITNVIKIVRLANKAPR